MLDLYMLITQGQYSPNTEFKTVGGGYYIYVEEEIIDVPPIIRRGGSGDYSKDGLLYNNKKKIIHLRVRTEDGKLFEKDIILDNINLKVSNVRQIDNEIIVEVSDASMIDSETVKININPVFD